MSVGEYDVHHCIIHFKRASFINVEPHSARVNARRAGPFLRSAVTFTRHEYTITTTTLITGRSVNHQGFAEGRGQHNGDLQRKIALCTSRSEDIFGLLIFSGLLTAV
jgi:hypothetical protein